MNLEKNLFQPVKKAAAILTLGSVLFGCQPHVSSKPDNSENPSSQVPEKVRIFSESDSQKISYLSENNIVFSQPANYSVGDIIVCGATPTTPDGLLRKISNISSDKKIVYTTQATIPELAKNYSAKFSKRLNPNEARSVSLGRGVVAGPRAIDLFDFNYNLVNKVVDLDGDLSTTYDQIKVNGNISLNSNIDFSWDIDGEFQLKRFEFRNVTSNRIDVSASALSDLSGLSKTIEIAKYDFPPITFMTPTTPPIPVVISPVLEINLNISGGVTPVSLNLNQNANLVLGLNYSGIWNPIKEFSNSFNSQFSQVPSLELLVNSKQKLSANLYGVAGPYAEASEYLGFLLNSLNWQIWGGLIGKAGMQMDLFGKNIADYDKVLFQKEEILASSDGSNPDEGNSSGEKIIFQSNRSPVGIYVMNSDGSNQRILIEGNVQSPKWNKTRDKIVYVKDMWPEISIQDPTQRYEIFITNADGSNPIRLTNNLSYDHHPCWSPDGTKIVFESGRDGLPSQNLHGLYIMNSDGTNQEKILNIQNNSVSGCDPCFSHDGNKIIYGGTNLYSINLSNKDMTQLVSRSSSEISCNSLGDILFNDGNNLYILDNGHSSPIPLIFSRSGDSWPSWSRDESKILFSSQRDGDWEIYSNLLNGTNLKKLTNNSIADIAPN
jgi:Tol biopolymer transport system component